MTNGKNPNSPSTQPSPGPKNDLEALGKELKGISIDELSRLKETLTAEQFEALKAQIEAGGNSSYKEYYKLGSAHCDKPIEKSDDKYPFVLVGSVDHSGYKMKWHEADWYDPYLQAAQQLSAFYEKNPDIFDSQTKKDYDRLKPAIDLFKTLGTYDKSEFNKKYKNEIWKIIKSEGSKSVYGKEGVLNFLLAFRRITSLYPDLKNVTKEDFDIGKLKESKIKLVFGKGEGKEERQKDRKAYIIMKKNPEKTPPVDASGTTTEPKKIPSEGISEGSQTDPNKPDIEQKPEDVGPSKPDTVPKPKDVGPSKPEEVPPKTDITGPAEDVIKGADTSAADAVEGANDVGPKEVENRDTSSPDVNPESEGKTPEDEKKIPEIGTEEFYKKYDIPFEDRQDFNDKVDLFKAWIEDEKKMALLTKDTFLEDLKNDPDQMKVYFNDGGTGLLDDLSKNLMEFENKYVDFFTDMENPLAEKIRDLHELVLVQILSQIDKDVEKAEE